MLDYRTCSKCGAREMQPPRYVHDVRGERLVRVCPNCGYVTSEKCDDAKHRGPSIADWSPS